MNKKHPGKKYTFSGFVGTLKYQLSPQSDITTAESDQMYLIRKYLLLFVQYQNDLKV